MYVFPFSTILKFPNSDDLTAILKFKTTCIATNPSWICAKCHPSPWCSTALVRLPSLDPPEDETLTCSCMSSAQTAFAQTQVCFCNYSKDGLSLLYWDDGQLFVDPLSWSVDILMTLWIKLLFESKVIPVKKVCRLWHLFNNVLTPQPFPTPNQSLNPDHCFPWRNSRPNHSLLKVLQTFSYWPPWL